MRRGPQVLGRLPAGVQVQLAADEQVDRGGVIIESSAGRLDARIAERLSRGRPTRRVDGALNEYGRGTAV